MKQQRVGLRLLETLTSALYEDPIIIFREYVQNSLDARNRSIDQGSREYNEFYVDIIIDNEQSNIQIIDNGFGIPQHDEFIDKMTQTGGSDKVEGEIGFRGIGRLSAMPLCRELVFTNKPKGIQECHVFTWNGDKFNSLLIRGHNLDPDTTLEVLTTSSIEKYDGDIDDHFFKVEIRGYKPAISETVKNIEDFKKRLSNLLPLDYSPEFTLQTQIKREYLECVGESLDNYICSVKLDGNELFKLFSNEDILQSGIVIWKLVLPSGKKENPYNNIGILWFSFNVLIKSRDTDEPHGVLVRSKNMLMGDQFALADAVIRSKSDYITTPRELYQMLGGICGEMLIKSENLQDNAPRDWFKIDEESIKLKNVIVEFLNRLHKYRYAASRYANDKAKGKKEEQLLVALRNLTTTYNPEMFLTDIGRIKKEIEAGRETFKYADEDIPTSSSSAKRLYDRLLGGLYEYYSGEGNIKVFYDVRSYIKKFLNQD